MYKSKFSIYALLSFILITIALIIMSIFLFPKQNSKTPQNFIDSKIAQTLNLYDSKNHSKIVQEYEVDENNNVKFVIGSDIDNTYIPVSYHESLFENIDFSSLTTYSYYPLPGTESFLSKYLKLKICNHKIISERNPFYWKNYDGKNHPTFGIKVLSYTPILQSIEENFQYYNIKKGYEYWTISMPPTIAKIAFVNKSNNQEKILSECWIKVASNNLIMNEDSNLPISLYDITFTQDFHSKKTLDAKTFNESIKLKDNVSDFALDNIRLANLINQSINFRICTWNMKLDYLWVVPNEKYAYLNSTNRYVIAAFIGKVLLCYKSLIINFR